MHISSDIFPTNLCPVCNNKLIKINKAYSTYLHCSAGKIKFSPGNHFFINIKSYCTSIYNNIYVFSDFKYKENRVFLFNSNGMHEMILALPFQIPTREYLEDLSKKVNSLKSFL